MLGRAVEQSLARQGDHLGRERGKLVDRDDAFDLGKQTLDQTKVAAGDASDRIHSPDGGKRPSFGTDEMAECSDEQWQSPRLPNIRGQHTASATRASAAGPVVTIRMLG